MCQHEASPTTYTNTAVKPLEMSLEMTHELFIHGNNGSFPKTIFITTSAAPIIQNWTRLPKEPGISGWVRICLYLRISVRIFLKNSIHLGQDLWQSKDHGVKICYSQHTWSSQVYITDWVEISYRINVKNQHWISNQVSNYFTYTGSLT